MMADATASTSAASASKDVSGDITKCQVVLTDFTKASSSMNDLVAQQTTEQSLNGNSNQNRQKYINRTEVLNRSFAVELLSTKLERYKTENAVLYTVLWTFCSGKLAVRLNTLQSSRITRSIQTSINTQTHSHTHQVIRSISNKEKTRKRNAMAHFLSPPLITSVCMIYQRQ